MCQPFHPDDEELRCSVCGLCRPRRAPGTELRDPDESSSRRVIGHHEAASPRVVNTHFATEVMVSSAAGTPTGRRGGARLSRPGAGSEQ
jgi:hypothetical protein